MCVAVVWRLTKVLNLRWCRLFPSRARIARLWRGARASPSIREMLLLLRLSTCADNKGSERRRDRRRRHIRQSFLYMPLSQAADPDSPAAPQTVCCCVCKAAWAERGLWTHQSPPTPADYSWGPASLCCPDAPNFWNTKKEGEMEIFLLLLQ